MNIRNAEIPNKVENPFLRAPYSPFYVPEPFKPGASKADLLRRLKARLGEMIMLCFAKEAILGPGQTFWPSQAWLDELSECIWRLASLHRRGGKDLWTCVRAIDNRHSRLNLGGKIEKLVDRAAKLYYEPAALAIQRQAIAGNQAAYGCFAALKRCHDGRSEIASENWSQYPEILQPRPAESCEAKAAQLVIDWLLDDLNPKKPWDCLASWYIGNPSLAAKLMRPDSANFYALVLGSGKHIRPKVSSPMRQKKYRRRKNHPISRSLMRILGAPAKRTRRSKQKSKLSSHQWERPNAAEAAFRRCANSMLAQVGQNFFVKERNAVIPSPRCRF